MSISLHRCAVSILKKGACKTVEKCLAHSEYSINTAYLKSGGKSQLAFKLKD